MMMTKTATKPTAKPADTRLEHHRKQVVRERAESDAKEQERQDTMEARSRVLAEDEAKQKRIDAADQLSLFKAFASVCIETGPSLKCRKNDLWVIYLRWLESKIGGGLARNDRKVIRDEGRFDLVVESQLDVTPLDAKHSYLTTPLGAPASGWKGCEPKPFRDDVLDLTPAPDTD